MIGVEFSNYRITAKIGEGGMATVYKAVHKTIPGLIRAIKVLHPALAMYADIKAKFIAEASAMAALNHPNIVKIYDYREQNGNLFLEMEYVDGMNLEEMIKNRTGPIPEERVKKIFPKVLAALSYAHSKDMVHRDIKPSNIIIATDGEPKVIDFGIVKILEDDHNPGKTKTGTRLGTPIYMSPEQILAKDVDRRSDIYALGVTLFQMITGCRPYSHALSEFEIQTKIINEPLPRIKTLYPPASDLMQAVIDKATAKKPERRYADCAEFEKALLGTAQPPYPPKHAKNKSIIIVTVIGLLLVAVIAGCLINKRWQTIKESNEYYLKGRQSFNSNNYDEANGYYSKAIELNSNNELALRERGRIKWRIHQNYEAINDLDKAIKIDKNDDSAFNLRGNAKNSLEKYNDAIDDFNKAIFINKRFSWPYNGRGMAKSSLEEYASAILDFDSAILIDHTFENPYSGRGYANYVLKNYKEALADYNSYIALNENDENAFYYRGLSKYQLDDKAGAFSDMSKAIALGDKTGGAYCVRGIIYYEYSQYNDACEDLYKSKSLGNEIGSKYYYKYCK